MKNPKTVITKSSLLKWLTRTVLVLGLITFSGLATEVRLTNAEPTKTELSEVRKGRSKRTVSFKRAFREFNPSHLKNRLTDLIVLLSYQENRVDVQLKRNFKKHPPQERDGFLRYYSTSNSEEWPANNILG